MSARQITRYTEWHGLGALPQLMAVLNLFSIPSSHDDALASHDLCTNQIPSILDTDIGGSL